MPLDQRTLLPISEAAARLGVTAGTLRRWEDEGRISAVRTVGNQRRFRVEDIKRLEKSTARLSQTGDVA
ncbi:MAG: helix-turn-helix domain-containing protein [Nocardioidaceae bacterium]